MALTNTFDTSTPAGSDDPTEADDRMREIKTAIRERMNDHNGASNQGDHYWPLSGTEVSDAATGQHRMVTLRQLTDDPDSLSSYTTITDLAFLYQKNVDGIGEFFFQDEDGNVKQITSGGKLNVASDEAVLLAGNQTVAGIKTFGSIPVLPASDPTADNQATRKKYVDDQIDETVGSGAMDPLSYTGTGVITLPNGVQFAMGISGTIAVNSNVTITPGFSTAVVNAVACNASSVGNQQVISVHTISGGTFKIHSYGGTTTTARWFAIGY